MSTPDRTSSTPQGDPPRCGGHHPDEGFPCRLNRGHHGRHGYAPEGSAEWVTWEPTP